MTFLRKTSGQGRETTQWLRALAAHLEDTDSVPSIHVVVYSCLTPVPRDLTVFTGLHRHQSHNWYTGMNTGKTSIQERKKKRKAASEGVSQTEKLTFNLSLLGVSRGR